MNREESSRWNLMIYGVPLGNNDLSFVRGQTKLEFLVLQEAGISDDQLQALVELPLRELILNKNPITDVGLQHLERMKNLKTLGITDTEVTSAGVKKLKQALPKCRVRWSDNSGK